MTPGRSRLLLLCVALLVSGVAAPATGEPYGGWMTKPQTEWPRIAMVNRIEYSDRSHPVAGCAFLLDTGEQVLAVTAKHILTYFNSRKMDSVSFGGSLKLWEMFPKDRPDDLVIVDRLVNEDPGEPIKRIPHEKDWLLFTVKKRTPHVQPLRFRPEPPEPGERVFIVGWRYTDEGRQKVYESEVVESSAKSLLISTPALVDNKVPGLSGSPVIDSKGYLVGLMSQKAGKLERPSTVAYPRSVLESARPEKD